MQFIKNKDVPSVTKNFGTKTDYYLFADHEIHYNEIAPHTRQPWHHHKRVTEELLVLNGLLTILWQDENEKIHTRDISKGTLVRVGKTIHTIANNSPEVASFIILKYIPTGRDVREEIKNDKVNDEVENGQ